MKKFSRSLVVAVLVGTGAVSGAAALVACNGVTPQTAANTGTTIAADLCTAEATATNEPGWVKLACQDVSDATKIINVIIPLVQWTEIQKSGVMAKKPVPTLADGGTQG